MPIYEYRSTNTAKGCKVCSDTFEIIQSIDEKPLHRCPGCGNAVKKIISWCRSSVQETPNNNKRVEKNIKEFEKAGMWSHAAELADKHSEKTDDKGLKGRALDNYKKAGYDVDSLAKHAKLNNDE